MLKTELVNQKANIRGTGNGKEMKLLRGEQARDMEDTYCEEKRQENRRYVFFEAV